MCVCFKFYTNYNQIQREERYSYLEWRKWIEKRNLGLKYKKKDVIIKLNYFIDAMTGLETYQQCMFRGILMNKMWFRILSRFVAVFLFCALLSQSHPLVPLSKFGLVILNV